MKLTRRQFALGLAALPAGCAFQPLAPLRTAAAPAPAMPAALRPPATGQRWTYRKYNGFNSALLATETDEITALAPHIVIRRRSDAEAATLEEHQQPWGQVLRDLSWDYVQNYEQAVPLWPSELTPGARSVHRTRYRIEGFSYRYWITQHTTVSGWERITLPAGELLALRIEHFIRMEHRDFRRLETVRRDTLWHVPEIGRWAAREVSGEYLITGRNGGFRGQEENHRWELMEWS
ncbi:MAG: hypothetical protein Q8R72_15965 [Hylemonella sp.]|nr:hypothetical protein [Hylemonella sp.]